MATRVVVPPVDPQATCVPCGASQSLLSIHHTAGFGSQQTKPESSIPAALYAPPAVPYDTPEEFLSDATSIFKRLLRFDTVNVGPAGAAAGDEAVEAEAVAEVARRRVCTAWRALPGLRRAVPR